MYGKLFDSRLRNSLTALTTCSLVFILALVGTSPMISLGTKAGPPANAPQALDVPASAEPGLDAHMQAVSEQATPTTTRRRRDNRQPLVMPYFSFAPRG